VFYNILAKNQIQRGGDA